MSQPQHNIVEVRIPIMNREVSVIDNEYGGTHGTFEAEMRKMEAEMSKLTGEISEGNKRIQSRIVQTTKTTTTRTSSSGNQLNELNQGQQQQQQFQSAPAPQQQIQFSSPQQSQVGSNLQSSTSTHTTRTSTSTGSHDLHQGQQAQGTPPPQQIQFSSPQGGSVGSVQSTTSTHTTRTHQTTGAQQQQQQLNQQQQQFTNDSSSNQELQQWMANLDSPLIAGRQEISGQDGKCLRLRFDVSQYRPDEISVKTVDGKLKIHAKHEEKSETKSAYREFNKEFSLPIGTNPEAIKSTLSKDGILTVEAPLPGQGQLAYQQHLPISNF